MVTTENKTDIMSNSTGEISNVNVEEGKEVKIGDVLFTIDCKITMQKLQI
jgi:multidrug resistance efflux pump